MARAHSATHAALREEGGERKHASAKACMWAMLGNKHARALSLGVPFPYTHTHIQMHSPMYVRTHTCTDNETLCMTKMRSSPSASSPPAQVSHLLGIATMSARLS